MFESGYLLIFFNVFSRGASRCTHVAKLAHGLSYDLAIYKESMVEIFFTTK